MIFEQTYHLIKKQYPGTWNGLFITDARIGTYLTAVSLSDGSVGTSATLTDNTPFCEKSGRDFGEFTPLKIRGRKVSEILATPKSSGLLSSLKTAVLSAVSSNMIVPEKYRITEDCDPVDLLDLRPSDSVVLVGAFQSYIRRISGAGCSLTVLEKKEECLTGEQKKYFRRAADFRQVLNDADIVIITGQTIVNNTIDDILSAITPGTQVIVTGPSCNLIPDALFANKVSILGGIKILNRQILLDLVSEGGTGYHLFEYSAARKISIINDRGKQA